MVRAPAWREPIASPRRTDRWPMSSGYILLACDYVNYARYSPGRLALDHAMAAWAADNGKAFDFTIGDEPFKADFGGTRAIMHEFQLAATTRPPSGSGAETRLERGLDQLPATTSAE